MGKLHFGLIWRGQRVCKWTNLILLAVWVKMGDKRCLNGRLEK
nr:MAG TPA: hypothetical protein [Caudoviricetes sp.]